jgi:L-lactate dehydrogenase complex protein LldG
MSSREKILSAIASNKPDLVDMPLIDVEKVISYTHLKHQFKETLEKIGGKVIFLENEDQLKEQIKSSITENEFVINTLELAEDKKTKIRNLSSYDLASLEKAYLRGHIGVAENGAIWVDELQMVNRLVPFICQHLFIVIKEENLVATMHHAYKNINVTQTGFGSFIAGPSKTADIEQSLVIGAHGARSLTVYIIEN